MDTREDSYTWKIFYNRFEPEHEGLREALFALCNGYFGTRGAAPEAAASKIHYPGTYIAGVYNRLTTRIAGRRVVNEDLVNCPNWTYLTFRIGDEEWFSPSTSRLSFYHQELDMRRGLLKRKVIFQNWKGQRTLVDVTILVHMGNPHIGAIKYTITPKDYSDWITVGSMLDGAVRNTGVERYRKLNSQHLRPKSIGTWGRNGVFLSMVTSQSRIEIAEASKICIFLNGREIKPSIKTLQKGKEIIGQEFKIFMRENKTCTIEKIVAIYTSKDEGIQNPSQSAINCVRNSRGFKMLVRSQERIWKNLWKKADIQIKGDTFSQKILRLHMFHLLQTATPHSARMDVGLPARGLHGEAYRGHIFWDGVFIFPFYNLHFPRISRALLLYRYRRLPPARSYARKKGYKGAMFPWQSASSGREETQTIHLNPISGKWGPDYSSIQRHISFAIAYNVWNYYQMTKDIDFLYRFGAELFLSLAQFASSLAKYSPKDKRFHTEGIMGPDEFHEKYPYARKPGLRDNAYSNLMIVWTLLKAKEIIALLPEDARKNLLKKLKITEREIDLWEKITRKMNIVINNRGIISQFDGYFRLKELDWEEYRKKYRNIHRLDRILKAEGKSPDEYKITKQADVLMIFYLLDLPEAIDIFRRLGYDFDKDKLKRNYEYYEKRTSHGSSLSKVVHCFVAHKLEMLRASRRWFEEVLESDFYDTQGGTTPEGIHIGVMGGSWDIVFRSFAGITILEDKIKIEPHLPRSWQSLSLKFCYRGKWISLSIDREGISIFIYGPRRVSFGVPWEIEGRLYYLLLRKTYRIPLVKKRK